MHAFDADELIYAAVPGHDLGERVQGWMLERRLAVIAPERRQARSLAIS